MKANAENEVEWGRRDRLLPRLDQMVESGRLTATEAERVRAASELSEFNSAVRAIRVRHAGLRLDAAVEDGSLTRADADGLLDRLSRGEHGRFLRAHMRKLHRGNRSRGPGTGSEGPEDTSR